MRKSEIGKSPYELIFRGEKKIDDVLLRIIDFNAEHLHEERLINVKKLEE